jgi:hypothetical protein
MARTVQRVAARYAMEHSSPEALKEYLTEHPKADPSKHIVKERDDHEEGPGEKKGPKKSVKERLQALAQKVKELPAAARKVVEDPKHRKEVLGKAGDSVKGSPKKYLQSLKKTWDHEKHEFKEAGSGIAAVMKGGKPSAGQKKAMQTVATHLAITAVAAALTSASPALAGLSMGKAMVKHLALKAAAKALGDLHVLEEMGHIGHGVHHVLDKLAADKASPEEAFSALVLKSVTETMGNLSDEDLADILESDESKTASLVATRYKVASRYKTASNEELASNFQEALRELKKYKAWVQEFPSTLKDAERSTEGLPEGHVWQAAFVDFWKPFDPIERRLMELYDELTINLDDTRLWGEASHYLDPPRGARIEDAISKPRFFNDASGKSQIAYPVKILESWYEKFSKWVDESIRGLGAVQAQAKRKDLI